MILTQEKTSVKDDALANAGVGDTLKVAENGNFWGAFKTADGASKFAQLQQAEPINASTVTTLTINPATMMMAVALYSIDQKLDKIEEMQRQIIDFLVCENESQIEADVQMLSRIISKYKFNWDNEHYVASNHKMVLDIQRKALQNIRSCQKQVSALLEKKQLFLAQNNVENTFVDMKKKFKYYRMALYTYSLASLLEIMLGGNFREEYICTVKTDIEQFSIDYRNFFETVDERISDKLASLIEPFTVGCRAARRGMIPCGKEQYVVGQNAVVFGCGTIGIAAAVALKHFGMEKVMICDRSEFRLKLAEQLGFAVCNTASENFETAAVSYFGMALSLNGAVADIDCWLDAAGAENILDDFLRLGKIESRFVSVAVNNKPREIDLLHMTYAQQSIIGSGGYMPEDVRDVQEIMASGKWNLESIITHEFSLDALEQAIRTASDVNHAGNVVIKMS